MQIKRCAIYTRVSTDNQAEGEFNSCESQEEKIRAFISSQESMEALKVYSDTGYTGANTDRPALREILQEIKAGRVDLVISTPRSIYLKYSIIEKLNTFVSKSGISFYF